MSDNNPKDKVFSAGQKTAEALEGGTGDKSLFDKEGAIGKQFQADGAIGSVGEAIGGPLSKDGVVGKQFSAEGSIGGTVQKSLGDEK